MSGVERGNVHTQARTQQSPTSQSAEQGRDRKLYFKGQLRRGVLRRTDFRETEQQAADRKLRWCRVRQTILRQNNIVWGNIAGILAFATETSLVFVLTLYLQQVLGHTALGAGLAFAVLGIGTVVGGIIAPKLIGIFENTNTIITGLTIQSAAAGSLFFINTDQNSLAIVLVATFVGGVAN
jgi:Na+/melibiose symporter-like transporter